jgi:predicted nucleotidyltransferase
MDLIQSRNQFSTRKIVELKKKISKLSYIKKFNKSLCIYVTGSFARDEASEYSDMDIFFISRRKNKIKNLDEIILKADLIKIIRELNLPDFSGDGEYLTIHCLEDIIEKLGSPEDDYRNYFTARLLLLLESKPLFNDKLYNEAILKIINVYFNDYSDHKESFSPKFLANDIMRFWKTMCLNYEQKRNSVNRNELTKNKARLKSLKLKFSRITTCYSLLCCLRNGEQTTPEDLQKLINLTPLERLLYTAKLDNAASGITDKMLDIYKWFLSVTADLTPKVIDWISDEDNQKLSTSKAEEYHNLFYSLLELTSRDLLKYYTL